VQKPYNNTLDCLVRTVREEGPVRGLFAGHTSTLARECPGNIAWFMGYEIGCRFATPAGTRREDLSPLVNCGAGALAGMMYWFVPFPADVVKSKIQTGTHGLPAHVSPSFMTVSMHLAPPHSARVVPTH
jgi:solute carrier family 25 carnitine/acylcarnitine transporter 20/29